MTADELVGVVRALGGANRMVTGTELRAHCRAHGIEIGDHGGRISSAERAELSSPSPRIVKWKAIAAHEVGFTLAEAGGSFPGWNIHG